jgi:hypothetical protein
MKFLSKRADSAILTQKITYKRNAGENNKKLRELLLKEQSNFCAYTEKFIDPLDSSEVEHFNSSLKYKDNYYNYYAVIRNANLYKQDEKYANSTFFQTLFFQNQATLKTRIGFSNNIYYEINEGDIEARDFIDFLGFNHPTLSEQRSKHIKRLKETFQEASYSHDDIEKYFIKYKDQLSFSTALETEFQIEFDKVLNI